MPSNKLYILCIFSIYHFSLRRSLRAGRFVCFIHLSPVPSTMLGILKALRKYLLINWAIDWQFHMCTETQTRLKQSYCLHTTYNIQHTYFRVCRMWNRQFILPPTLLPILEFSDPVLLSALEHVRTWRHSQDPQAPKLFHAAIFLENSQYRVFIQVGPVLWTGPPFPPVQISTHCRDICPKL